MHALAELMDNATRFSAAGSEVLVSVQEAEAGLLILVEDGGVGLQDRERRRAEALVAGPADLSTLPGSGLGLASVGRVAARYGLTVSFRPSAQGGTTAALLIPRSLVVPPIPDPVPVPAEPVAAGVAAPSAPPRGADLPKRAPGRTRPARPGPGATGPAPDGASRPAPDGAALGDSPVPGDPALGGPAAAPGAAAGRRPDPAARFAAFRQAAGDQAQPGAPTRPETEAP